MIKHKYTIDLHTHSISSHDGGISVESYERAITSGLLDYIAITDHNQILFAQELHKKHGDSIIVGEEIMTEEGEIIGLFLETLIKPGLSVERTIYNIHEQEGLVYIPHPFEKVRKGLQKNTLEHLIFDIDIIEVFNARAFGRWKNMEALNLAKQHTKACAASSDAHGFIGLGSAYSMVSEKVTKKNLVNLLLHADLKEEHPSVFSYMSPLYNRLRKRMRL